MKAVQCVRYSANPYEALQVLPVEKPRRAKRGCLLVQVLACGVDFVQTLLMQNKYQLKTELPITLGGEATGIVVEVGTGVEGFEVGDLVHGAGAGCFSEYVQFPAFGVIKLDPDSDPVYAPSLYSYVTSLHALKYRAKLQQGETLLVLGASGGIGSTAIQIGKILGATVIAAASNEEKLKTCEKLGADYLINYEKENLKLRVREITNNDGANVVFDPVGDRFTEPAIRALSWRGRLVTLGFAAGEIPKIPINLLLLKEASIVGAALREANMNDPFGSLRERDELVELHSKGLIHPLVSKIFRMQDAPEAFELIQKRRAHGKIVLITEAYEKKYGSTLSRL
mmetsp:Transcript_7955/g.9104  ORF Transcript_7955/g.9104 Transcript_7955/m.9104 type:complete len:340 (-) Transcript_7955:17-1036(-)